MVGCLCSDLRCSARAELATANLRGQTRAWTWRGKRSRSNGSVSRHPSRSRQPWMRWIGPWAMTYDRMARLLAPYGSSEGLAIARALDMKVEGLLREAAAA